MAGKNDTAPTIKSAEFVLDSSDEDAEDSEAASSEEELPDPLAILHGETQGSGRSRRPKAAPTSASTSDEVSSVEQDNHNGPSKALDEAIKAKSGKKASKKSQPRLTVVAAIPAKTYKAPQGFSQVIASTLNTSSSTAKILHDLSGKQVWHIIAPSLLPITAIKEFNVNSVHSGAPIVNHQGRVFRISKVANSSKDQAKVLRQVGQGGKFREDSYPISQTFQICEIPRGIETINLAIPAQTSLVASVTASQTSKPPRKQPPGLLMRYKPFGTHSSPAGTTGSSDQSEGEDGKFRMPRQPPSPPQELPHKKRKKTHRMNPNPARSGSLDAMDLDSPNPSISAEPQEVAMTQPSSLVGESSSQTKEDKNDHRDKKARKEEKRRRKRDKGLLAESH